VDNPELQRELAKRKDQMRGGMQILIKKAARVGNVSFVLPLSEVVRAGQALLRGLLMERLLGENSFSDQQFIDIFAAFVTAMARPGHEKNTEQTAEEEP